MKSQRVTRKTGHNSVCKTLPAYHSEREKLSNWTQYTKLKFRCTIGTTSSPCCDNLSLTRDGIWRIYGKANSLKRSGLRAPACDSNSCSICVHETATLYCVLAESTYVKLGNVLILNTWGDSDVISMPVGFSCHLVGKTLSNGFHCNLTEIRFVGKLVIIKTFLISERIEFHLSNTINLHFLTPQHMPCYTHNMAVVSWP